MSTRARQPQTLNGRPDNPVVEASERPTTDCAGAPLRPAGKRLTPRQQVVLETIEEHCRVHQRPPTIRWLGDRLGISSTNGVCDHLKALQRKGYLVRDCFEARGIRLLRPVPTDAGVEVPVQELATVARLAYRVHVEREDSLRSELRAALLRLALKSPSYVGATE